MVSSSSRLASLLHVSKRIPQKDGGGREEGQRGGRGGQNGSSKREERAREEGKEGESKGACMHKPQSTGSFRSLLSYYPLAKESLVAKPRVHVRGCYT